MDEQTHGQTDRRRPLKVGLILPHWEAGMSGKTPGWSDITEMATLAEDIGFDSLWLVDHFLNPYTYRGEDKVQGFWDCWTILPALASTTKNVELGTLVTCTAFRNPALMAKMAATVDEISGGRLILGIGAGWNEYEYRAFGYPYDHRVSRFEEALTIIHGLLHEGYVDFHGKYYDAHECEMRPRGPRPGKLPIMIGSSSERMLGLTARYADSWNRWLVYSRSHPDQIPAAREKVDAACLAAGRDPSTLERTASVQIDLKGTQDPQAGKQSLIGTPEEMAETIRAFAAEGISHLQIMLRPNVPEAIEKLAAVLEILDRG
ncbi:MAG TPA: LLM class flavin-dependent oxidoreductase [Nitrolancea sp.]|nr:LLM class flavin-dependent oxidoreductase [Nitrolancea sp.]